MRSTCERCGKKLPIKAGRPARFCSGACRQAAYRSRKASQYPPEMRAATRWVLARGKRPFTTTGRAASSTNPQTWTTYDATRTDDHGFMLGGGFACIDIDHCFNSRGQLFGWAKAIVEAAEGAWIERSISGKGLHIFGLAFEAPGHHYGRVEVYSTDRFIRTTSNVYQPGELIPLANTTATIRNLHRAGTIPPRPVKEAA